MEVQACVAVSDGDNKQVRSQKACLGQLRHPECPQKEPNKQKEQYEVEGLEILPSHSIGFSSIDSTSRFPENDKTDENK
jgi:hypothetical protein